jgi:hypothetical protein
MVEVPSTDGPLRKLPRRTRAGPGTIGNHLYDLRCRLARKSPDTPPKVTVPSCRKLGINALKLLVERPRKSTRLAGNWQKIPVNPCYYRATFAKNARLHERGPEYSPSMPRPQSRLRKCTSQPWFHEPDRDPGLVGIVDRRVRVGSPDRSTGRNVWRSIDQRRPSHAYLSRRLSSLYFISGDNR